MQRKVPKKVINHGNESEVIQTEADFRVFGVFRGWLSKDRKGSDALGVVAGKKFPVVFNLKVRASGGNGW